MWSGEWHFKNLLAKLFRLIQRSGGVVDKGDRQEAV